MMTVPRGGSVLAGFLIVAAGWLGCAPTPDKAADSDAAAALVQASVVEAVGEEWWQLLLAEEPWLQQMKGAPIHMPDLGSEHAAELMAQARALLGRLASVDAAVLEHQDQLSLEILRWDIERFGEWTELHYRLPRLTPYMFSGNGIHGVFQQLQIDSAEDAERYLELAADYPDVVRDLLSIAQTQAQYRWAVAEPALDQVVGMWSTYAEKPESLFSVCARQDEMPDDVPEDFCQRLDATVEGDIVPALRDLVDFVDGPYRETAPAVVGLGRYPGGEHVYRALIRTFVTYDADPQEVHALGNRQLAENEARMAELRKELGLPFDRAAAHEALKKDPRVLASTPEEVGERLMAYIERLKPRVGEVFDLMPRAPYGVKRLDPALEGAKTFGYYNPPTPQEDRGLYYFNGSALEERPMLSAGSLIYHELIPGHHFQVGLQMENEQLPQWRRDATFHSGYSEGWAEYASSLMMELGMYESPLDEYGRLASENFFANRLVVDTGMHAMGWTLEKARRVTAENTLLSETEIRSETLRYATDLQAQALAYALGAAKIRKLRERARVELGDSFDLRAFHRAVLDSGSMPLAVLETHVEWWIEQQQASN